MKTDNQYNKILCEGRGTIAWIKDVGIANMESTMVRVLNIFGVKNTKGGNR